MEYKISKKEISELKETYQKGLLENIMPFWLKYSIDKEDGGFIFSLNRDGSVIDTDKGVWQTCRFTWLLSELYNEIEKNKLWLETAKHGIDFIDKHCFDTDGRMFFQLDKKGNPLRKRRYVFSEAFGAIAYSAYYKATGIEEYAQKARQTFNTMVKYNTEPGLLPPKFTENRKMKGLATSMISIVTAQELRKNLEDDTYTEYVDKYIAEIKNNFMNYDYKVVMETVGENGEFIDSFEGRTLNPGHSIEGAWFILQEAKNRNNDKQLIELGCTILDWMFEKGWDKEYGGILYFRDVKNLPVQEYWHDMKFWWPQNETIIATALAYQLTSDDKYMKWHKLAKDWAFSHFPDKEHGEWFGYLHRDGRISVELKGNLWKGPFHIPRMYFKCAEIFSEIENSMREKK